MYFADFKNIKIVKEYNPMIKEAEVFLYKNAGLMVTTKEIDKVIAQLISDVADYPTLYSLSISSDMRVEPEDYIENAQFVLSIANYFVPALLQALETGKGYKRERRLGAPDVLKPLHTTYATIKRAVNSEMKNTCLNIQVKFGDISYILCDGKEIDYENVSNTIAMGAYAPQQMEGESSHE